MSGRERAFMFFFFFKKGTKKLKARFLKCFLIRILIWLCEHNNCISPFFWEGGGGHRVTRKNGFCISVTIFILRVVVLVLPITRYILHSATTTTVLCAPPPLPNH